MFDVAEYSILSCIYSDKPCRMAGLVFSDEITRISLYGETAFEIIGVRAMFICEVATKKMFLRFLMMVLNPCAFSNICKPRL